MLSFLKVQLNDSNSMVMWSCKDYDSDDIVIRYIYIYSI